MVHDETLGDARRVVSETSVFMLGIRRGRPN